MKRNFNSIMEQLTHLLEKGAEDDPNRVGGGNTIVNNVGSEAKVGAETQSIPSEAKGDVSLTLPHKDGDTLEYDKENAYPSTSRNPDKSSKEVEKSKIGDDDMGLEDKAEKRASYRARNLLDSIESLIDGEVTKYASAPNQFQRTVDQMSLQKAASFEAGQAAATAFKEFLKKYAEDSNSEKPNNSSEHRGDLADTIVSKLVPRSDPHDTSDGKSPETEPSQPKYGKASDQDQGNAKVDSTLESKAEVMYMKARLWDDLEKAAMVDDDAAIAIAKANIVDFIQAYGV